MSTSDGYAPRMHLARCPHLLLLAALVLLAALFAAGCGEDGPSKDEYEDGLRTVQRQLAAANEASRESGEATGEARTEKLEEAHDKIAAAAKTADGLKPPSDATKAHEQLSRALSDYATLFQQLATLEPGTGNESELYSRAGEIVDELGEANRELDKLGYDVTPAKSST